MTNVSITGLTPLKSEELPLGVLNKSKESPPVSAIHMGKPLQDLVEIGNLKLLKAELDEILEESPISDRVLDGFFISVKKIFNLDFYYMGPSEQVLISSLGQPIPHNGVAMNTPDTILGSEMLLGIIKTRNHWNLWIVDWKRNVLLTYDPSRAMERTLLQNIFDFVSVLRYQKQLPCTELSHFDINNFPHTPRQNEDHPHSCGVYVAIIGLFIALRSQLVMPEPIIFYRRLMLHFILKGSLPHAIIHDHNYCK